MSFSEALVYMAAIGGVAVVAVYFIRALWPETLPAELENRALVELALVRDELSKLRADTAKDRDELRKIVSQHDQAFIETTHRVNDCLKETSKLSMAYGSAQMRK